VNRNFYITTFGCRTNQADSSAIRDGFLEAGYREVDSPASAGVIIVNSCTVTHRSDQQVRQLTRKLHRQNPAARIVVTGCYAQRDPEAVGEILGVSVVVGNTRKNELVQLLEASGPDAGQSPLLYRESFEKQRSFSIESASSLPAGARSRPLVKIQDGCDAKCAYCIVPTVRGPSRSVPPEIILHRIRELLERGFREIVLTGIHMGTYGMHLTPRIPLDGLIEKLCRLPGDWRLRLSSIEPMELSRRVIDLAASSEKLAPHFHICVQSGSDPVLRRMLRPYSASKFASIVEYIHDRIPRAGIGTDVICGFPGETEEDHRRTVTFLEKLPFTYIHVFPYSDRSGTAASEMPGKVSSRLIRERCREIRELSEKKNREFRRSQIGEEISLLTLTKACGSSREALSDNYRHLI